MDPMTRRSSSRFYSVRHLAAARMIVYVLTLADIDVWRETTSALSLRLNPLGGALRDYHHRNETAVGNCTHSVTATQRHVVAHDHRIVGPFARGRRGWRRGRGVIDGVFKTGLGKPVID